jgi:hypothetical protein
MRLGQKSPLSSDLVFLEFERACWRHPIDALAPGSASHYFGLARDPRQTRWMMHVLQAEMRIETGAKEPAISACLPVTPAKLLLRRP